jgi:hypothetical protein
MPRPRVNAWYGWVPDRPDFRDKLCSYVTRGARTRGMKGYFTMPYDYASNSNLADDLWTIRAFGSG